MSGFSAQTLQPISREAWLSQAIRTVLLTPVGTRVMRRDFGSSLKELIDQPQNASTTVKIYGATAVALMRWLPVFRLARVMLEHLAPGRAQLVVEGFDTAAPTPNALLRIGVPLQLAAGAGAANLTSRI